MSYKIHTGLYTPKAREFLDRIFHALARDNSSNERWGNGRRYGKIGRSFRNAKFELDPNNELVLEVATSYDSWNAFTSNHNKAKDWLAHKIKDIVIRKCSSDGAWRRDNERQLNFLASNAEGMRDYGEISNSPYIPTVSEAYFIYEYFMNRKKLERRYGKKMVEEIIGTQRDPIATEMEASRRAEVERIKKEFYEKSNALEAEKTSKFNDFKKALDAEYTEKRQAIADARDKALRELEEMAKSIATM